MSYIHRFSYIFYLDHIKWKIVFFVKSSAGNFGRREAIRNTWGSVKVYRSALIKVIFVIGSSNNKIKSQLEQEIIEHKDILQMDLEESSRYFKLFNLNKKFKSVSYTGN